MSIPRLERLIERLYTRIMSNVAQCIITIVNDAGGIQTAQLNLGAQRIKDATPRMQEYGFTSNPPPGSFAIAEFVGGDISNGVIIATDNFQFRPTGLAPGEAKMYDNLGKFIYLSAGGIVIEAGGMPVQLLNAGTVTMNTPLLRVTGDIIDNYSTQTHTMAAMREIYDTHTHNYNPGPYSATATGIPNQPE